MKGISVETLAHPDAKRSTEGVITAFAPFTRELLADAGERPVIRFIGTSVDEDRYGSVIDPMGGDLTAYRANPVFLWAHIYDEFPVGKCTNIIQTPQLIAYDIEFAVNYEKGRVAYGLYRDDFLRGVSIGILPKAFEKYDAVTIPKEYAENRIYTAWEQLELSGAPVPANRYALKLALDQKKATENELRALGLEPLLALARDSSYILLCRNALIPGSQAHEEPGVSHPTPELTTSKSAPNAQESAPVQAAVTPDDDVVASIEYDVRVCAGCEREFPIWFFPADDAERCFECEWLAEDGAIERAGAVLSKDNHSTLADCHRELHDVSTTIERCKQRIAAVLDKAKKPEPPPADEPMGDNGEPSCTPRAVEVTLDPDPAIDVDAIGAVIQKSFGEGSATPTAEESASRSSDADDKPTVSYFDLYFKRAA